MGAQLREFYQDNIEMGNSLNFVECVSIQPVMETCDIV